MPFEVTTSSVSVHSTTTSGIAYSPPGPIDPDKSGKTEIGHSPSAGKALSAGTLGAGASVDATSAVVVVCSPESATEVSVGLSASDDELHAIKVNANAAKARFREIFIPTV
jgi:hypothetical protein